MAKIKKYGEKVLREKSAEVKEINVEIMKLLSLMKKVLIEEEGLGLAAPQVGVSKRIFIAMDKDSGKIITAVNPMIISKEGSEIDFEGCLSFPEIFFSIGRAKRLVLNAIDESGNPFSLEAEGLLARCIQHEIDHLDGKLIVDYATEQEKNLCKQKLERLGGR